MADGDVTTVVYEINYDCGGVVAPKQANVTFGGGGLFS